LANTAEEAEEAKKAKEAYEVLEEVLATLPCSDAERARIREQYRQLEEIGKKPFFLAG
jgi:cytochrome c-type biogenesis protein CcmH/NrfG